MPSDQGVRCGTVQGRALICALCCGALVMSETVSTLMSAEACYSYAYVVQKCARRLRALMVRTTKETRVKAYVEL